MTLPVFVGFMTMIGFTVAANLLLKLAADRQDLPVLLALVNGYTVVGFFAYACAGIIYAWLLKSLPLNVAQSFSAAQFVAVIVASSVVLSEPIGLLRWGGIMLIAAGILVVAWSAS
jgi:drug/metabolite transporter (DMT)-like permease